MKSFCSVCGTLHVPGGSCPGTLSATGEEYQGRRLTVKAAGRVERIAVLLAPSDDLWRARILTYPKLLWCVPGGITSVKFTGASPEEAEEQALQFVREHCGSRNYTILSEDAEAAGRSVPGASEPYDQVLQARSPRYEDARPARFGRNRPDRAAWTVNVSREGMFLAAPEPLPAGTRIRIALRLERFEVPLRGRVAWSRDRAHGDHPAGMGIRLEDPPAMYVRYVEGVANRSRTG